MHVVLCHDALIPPRTYGGTERVIYWLAKALNALGHRTSLVAREGSAIDGTSLIPLRRNVELEELIPRDADIVHLWATPIRPLNLPFIVTIQGNGAPNERFHPNTVFISRKHALLHGSDHYVYNGVDPLAFDCAPVRENYAVFLAKASWKVKNLEGAVAVARSAGVELAVLGSRSWPFDLQRYLPAWRGVRYYGMVDDELKRRLLSRARALLFPVRWEEPFGIAVVEALFSGCPVLATPYGSLPEIISPEVGLLTTSGHEMAQALRSSWRFSPTRCRAHALKSFSHLSMARGYLAYYKQVLEKGQLDNHAQTSHSSSKLLPWTFPVAIG